MDLKSVDILIMTALSEELEALRTNFSLNSKAQSSSCQLTYNYGPLQTNKEGVFYLCAATCLHDMGNTGAGVNALNAIRDLNPNYVIMFGIAAGIEGKVKLGDIIIPTQIFYYELAKVKTDDVIEVRPQSYQSDALLQAKLADFATLYANGHNVEFGTIAVGEKVVAHTNTVEKLKSYDPKLVGIEMESYGVAKAAAGVLQRPRFISIRGISDYADENKNDEYREIALDNAAKFFSAFLSTGVLPKEKLKLTRTEVDEIFIAIHHLSLNKRLSIKSVLQDDSLEYKGLEFREIMIDQTNFYNNGVLSKPTQALRQQATLLNQLNAFADDHPAARIGYFGLAHIPFIFHAGYQINRRKVIVFPTDRQTGDWIPLKKSGRVPKLHLEQVVEEHLSKSKDVIVRISVSYLVRPEQIEGIVENPLASFHLKLDEPEPDTIINEKQLYKYAKQFHSLLVDIVRRFPRRERVHLFMSVPPTLAFVFGQQVSKTIDSNILVYNFSRKDNPEYGWAVNIMNDEVIDFRSNV